MYTASFRPIVSAVIFDRRVPTFQTLEDEYKLVKVVSITIHVSYNDGSVSEKQILEVVCIHVKESGENDPTIHFRDTFITFSVVIQTNRA